MAWMAVARHIVNHLSNRFHRTRVEMKSGWLLISFLSSFYALRSALLSACKSEESERGDLLVSVRPFIIFEFVLLSFCFYMKRNQSPVPASAASPTSVSLSNR